MGLEERFRAKVAVGAPNDCWEWQGTRRNDGYGLFWNGSRQVRAHRAAWELEHSSIPQGLNICHRCDNPPCVNPSHLFLGTQKDNLDDMREKGRDAEIQRQSGDEHWLRRQFAGMTPEQRFWAQVEKTDTCWVWRGGCTNWGPAFRFEPEEVQRQAHRVAWEPTSDALVPAKLHRTCAQPLCVNPAHLASGPPPGSHDHNSGSQNPAAKLTEGDVRRIRQLTRDGEPATALASSHGLNVETVRRIIRRTSWTHVV